MLRGISMNDITITNLMKYIRKQTEAIDNQTNEIHELNKTLSQLINSKEITYNATNQM